MEQVTTTRPWESVTEIKIVYENPLKPSERPGISDSADANRILRKCWNQAHLELVMEFKVILMNYANKVLGVLHLSSGSTYQTLVDVKYIFAVAIKANACKLIVAHNNPSGQLKVSETDRTNNERIKEVAKLLDIRLCDHLILTSEGYYSLADTGEL